MQRRVWGGVLDVVSNWAKTSRQVCQVGMIYESVVFTVQRDIILCGSTVKKLKQNKRCTDRHLTFKSRSSWRFLKILQHWRDGSGFLMWGRVRDLCSQCITYSRQQVCTSPVWRSRQKQCCCCCCGCFPHPQQCCQCRVHFSKPGVLIAIYYRWYTTPIIFFASEGSWVMWARSIEVAAMIRAAWIL